MKNLRKKSWKNEKTRDKWKKKSEKMKKKHEKPKKSKKMNKNCEKMKRIMKEWKNREKQIWEMSFRQLAFGKCLSGFVRFDKWYIREIAIRGQTFKISTVSHHMILEDYAGCFVRLDSLPWCWSGLSGCLDCLIVCID